MNAPPVDLSILVPCFNEELRLRSTVEQVLAWADAQQHTTELILVDDGSADRTGDIIREASASDQRVVAVRLHTNRGKGAALRAGAQRARGRAVAFFDADLSYPLDGLRTMLSEIEAGADVVVGGRDLDVDQAMRSYSAARRLSSFAFNALVDSVLDLHVPDTQCGFKAFRGPVAAKLFRHMTIDRFGFDVELLFLVKRWGLRLVRIPVRMTHREGSTVRMVRDSVQMARDLWRIRRQSRHGAYPQDAGLTPGS